MLPRDESATIQAGARGDYDHYYTQLATAMVETGHADSIVRIGWEFNLGPSRWFTEDAEAFRAYWRRIAEAMSAVPGANFKFDWNVSKGDSGVDATAYYPGDDVVDFIGVDAYDVSFRFYPYPQDCDDDCREQRQLAAWDNDIYGGDRGLRFWSEFARRHDKPLSIPEWGLWDRPDGRGGGTNPLYLRKMHEFIVDPDNNVAYHGYFEHNGSDGDHRLMTTFPEAGDLFRQLFANRP